MNKTNLTNLICLIIVLIGYLLASNIILMVGLFALSGSLTNTFAIHMLFHKVPFLYGSGVIEEKFESFKQSIHSLIMNQFFTKENIEKFLNDESENIKIDEKLSSLIEKTNFEPAFDSLKGAVLESPFGGMLGMLGGEKALEPLKEPFEKKLKTSIIEITKSNTFQTMASEVFKNDEIKDDMIYQIELIVQSRLNELTPFMVKEIIQKVIHEHLGWLVLWGGVFGGLIGFIASFIR